MSRTVKIDLPDDLYESAAEAARRAGQSVEEWAASRLAQSLPTRENGERPAGEGAGIHSLMKWAGSMSFEPFGSNEELDRALAEEYMNPHKDED